MLSRNTPVAMLTRPQLLLLGLRYADSRNCSLYTVGRLAAGNNTLFLRMQAGGDCRSATAEKVGRWLIINWPPGEPWPTELPPRRELLRHVRVAHCCPDHAERAEP